jgi:NAD(P)-dependent dehydrogenase (short-subunit alcohol dehydrogenase family)
MSSSAFVTGASRGIGLAMVGKLLSRGGVHSVVAAARTASRSPGLAALRAQHGERLIVVDMDVTDAVSIDAAAGLCEGPCGLLVHGAAMMHPSGKGENTIRRIELEEFSTVMATNVIGPALLTKALYPRLREASKVGVAKVVAIGAGVGSVGTNAAGGWYSYRVSKTALNALMKNLAIEGARYNILTATLYPEMVDTDFAQPYVKNNPYPQLRTPDETAARMLELADELTDVESSGRFVNIWSKADIPW